MRKALQVVLCLMLITSLAFAGGIVTNSNQSAEYMRTMNRNASTDVDAVYYNPGAVTGLGDGLHIYLSNQTIYQTRTVTATFDGFNNPVFEGYTFAPLFPNAYVAYVRGNLGISGGLLPIGGGGSAIFEDGLPSFERQIANTGTSSFDGYSLDIHFEGSSVYLGFQGGITYELADMLGLYAGVRMVSATNTYSGHLLDVTFLSGTTEIPAATINPGFADVEVDVEQKGSTMTMIFAANLAMKGANVSVRYETLSAMEVENDTKSGDILFPDGAITQSDIPAQLAIGAGYRLSEKLYVTGTYDLWFNTDANWGGRELLVNNGYEAGGAVEYNLSESLLVSAGVLVADGGALDEYQKDQSNSLKSTTITGGGRMKLGCGKYLSLGLFDVLYQEGQTAVPEPDLLKLMKTTIGVAVGYQHSF